MIFANAYFTIAKNFMWDVLDPGVQFHLLLDSFRDDRPAVKHGHCHLEVPEIISGLQDIQ